MSLAEPEPLTRIMRAGAARRAALLLRPAVRRAPAGAPADFLHGAACHACLFVSETTCERGNRFLDRRFIVPIDADFPALVLMTWEALEKAGGELLGGAARRRCAPRSSTRWRQAP